MESVNPLRDQVCRRLEKDCTNLRCAIGSITLESAIGLIASNPRPDRSPDSRARLQSYIDYGFHLIISNPSAAILGTADGDGDKEGELAQIVAKEGITSVKLYMTYPAYRLGDREMLDVMLRCREVGMTVLVHAENADMVDL